MFAKVHEQIFSSSIMEEDVVIRYIWLCFLVLADKDGIIDITIPAIARRINIDEDLVKRAIDKFMQPDETSRTPDSDGRRIEPIRESFGWRVINKAYYDSLRSESERREYMRNYMKDKRAGEKATVINSKQSVSDNEPLLADVNTPLAVLAHTDVDVDIDIIKEIPVASLAFLWNKICINLSKVIELSKERRRKEKIRLSERPIESWKAVFTKINNSEFCKGYNDKGWQATYDWIISNSDNAIKVLEGKYRVTKKPEKPMELCSACKEPLHPFGISATTYKTETGEIICDKCETKRLQQLKRNEEDDYEENDKRRR